MKFQTTIKKVNEFKREIPRLPECPALSQELIKTITSTVFIESNPQKAEVLFVFGSSYGDKWSEVADLYKKGFAPIVYIAGGVSGNDSNSGKILSHMIRDHFLLSGVPFEAITIDESSSNTLEDAVFGKKIFLEKNIPHDRILFASKAVHSGRCLRTLKKVFPKSKLFPFTYEFTYNGETISAANWWEHDLGRCGVYGEYQRIKNYSARGDISD